MKVEFPTPDIPGSKRKIARRIEGGLEFKPESEPEVHSYPKIVTRLSELFGATIVDKYPEDYYKFDWTADSHTLSMGLTVSPEGKVTQLQLIKVPTAERRNPFAYNEIRIDNIQDFKIKQPHHDRIDLELRLGQASAPRTTGVDSLITVTLSIGAISFTNGDYKSPKLR